MPKPVTETAAALPPLAAEHFAGKLAFEADCADVHAALKGGAPGFVLLEARGPEAYAPGHVPGALNLPHGAITEEALAAWPRDALFVVYCAGPHCPQSGYAAEKLQALGYTNVRAYEGGLEEWTGLGRTVERTEEPVAV